MNNWATLRKTLLVLISACCILRAAEAKVTGEKLARGEYCGAKALFVAQVALQDSSASLAELLEVLGEPPKGGYSIDQLATAGQSVGLEVLPAWLTEAALRSACIEADVVPIICVDGDHFANVSLDGEEGFALSSPPSVEYLRADELGSRWDGASLLLATKGFDLKRFLDNAESHTSWIVVGGLLLAVGLVVVFFWVKRWRPALATLLLLFSMQLGCRQPIEQISVQEVAPEVAPRIQLSSNTFDFGDLVLGRKQDQPTRIEIVNAGNAMLSISEVGSTCGCAVAKLSSKDIPPGESEFLDLQLDKSTIGQRGATLHINSNDPMAQTVRADVLWFNRGIIEPSIREIDFGRVGFGEQLEQKFTLGLPTATESQLAEVRLDPSFPNASLKWDGNRVHLQLKSGADAGIYSATVTGEGVDGERLFSVPVSWAVGPALEVSPKYIKLDSKSPARFVLKCYDLACKLDSNLLRVLAPDGVSVDYRTLSSSLVVGTIRLDGSENLDGSERIALEAKRQITFEVDDLLAVMELR